MGSVSNLDECFRLKQTHCWAISKKTVNKKDVYLPLPPSVRPERAGWTKMMEIIKSQKKMNIGEAKVLLVIVYFYVAVSKLVQALVLHIWLRFGERLERIRLREPYDKVLCSCCFIWPHISQMKLDFKDLLTQSTSIHSNVEINVP